ncbi:MAG: PAS domain-containing protein [Myxococcales bacterium]|nr:PAS domain-containing protein [Myxococcales bacterium]
MTSRTPLQQAQTLQLFDTLMGSGPLGFVFLDRDLRFVLINEAHAEKNGFSVAAHLGRTVGELHPTLEATLRAVTERILATGQPVLDHEFTGETPRAPGVTRTWSESWYPVPDERGEIIGFGAVVVDITERKHAETALQLSNHRFELAVKASKAVLWQQDLQMRFIWLHNPAPGIDAADPVGKRDEDLLERAEDAAVIVGMKREVMRTGVGMRREFFPQIQGVVRSFEVLMEPLLDDAGHVTGHTGAAIDITERKNAEAAQRETDRNYRALAEASSEIPYRFSADWSTLQPLDGRGLLASSARPLANWAWMDRYVPQDEHARLKQLVSDAAVRKCLFEMEHRFLRPDGSTGWVRSRAVPILDEHQGLVAWFGVVSDITERKQTELMLIEATAVAEKANRAKSEFLSNMSHELRTPLHAILGFAQLMELVSPAPTPTQSKNLAQIVKGGWYLLNLINELLDLAQIESGKLPVTLEAVSLAEVMLECQALIEPQANKRGIGVTFPSFALLGTAYADRTRVKQVMINFLSNAIKYNKAEGAVTVDYALSGPEAIRVSVRDTGEGLAPEKVAQLFQPFNRLGREGGGEEGTGIGLVMSKRLVELMGGSIGAESTVGVGSVFWFELKWAPAAGQAVLPV